MSWPAKAGTTNKEVGRRGQYARRFLAVSLLRSLERRLLFRACFFLIALFPLRGRHAVDDFAGLIFFQRDAFFGGGFAVPVAQTVAAETGEIHQVDILHICPLA